MTYGNPQQFTKKRRNVPSHRYRWALPLEANAPIWHDCFICLTILHSNAAEERVFSMIKKNKTEFRANLKLSKSLDFIMLINMNSPEELIPCNKMEFSKESLKVAN